ncbi:FAD-dependent oxidoreductase [Piscinibacter sp.]|uniref:FAD-dependent oxidoreductase n=1 Tax=Piscinibacter sp. TaxID=1903157 RepID=UPI00355A0D82
MRVAIIGAGIVGVTTAFELARDGHDVAVFERSGSVAAEGSFANAGLVAPGYVTPWAAPGMPGKVLRHLLSSHAPVRVNARINASMLAWMWKWWRACRAATFRANRARMQRLALYSKQRLNDITRSLALDYERAQGCLVLLRSAQDLALAQPGLTVLRELGVKFGTLDSGQCRTIEPGLNPDMPLHAGIHLPDDEVGNCRQFAHLLRNEAQQLGARFRFHTDVRRIVPGTHPQLVSLYSPPEEATLLMPNADTRPLDDVPTEPMPFEPATESFDAVVVCAAVDSTALLAPHGLKLPLAAVYGYSVTAPMRHQESHPDSGPRSALVDERYKVAISRMGSRVRVAGSAELGGSLKQHNAAALDTLYKVLHDWFPGVAEMGHAQRWKGARPMLPDGPPVLGKSGIDGVWLNLGHGSSGWALACGSARVLADLMAGHPPSIDIEGLGIERLRR